MNTPDGYWIGSADCGGLDHAVCGKITISKGALLLAYSDGLLEALDLFGINNEDETIFNENRLKNVVCELRKCQSGDSERKVARVRKKMI